jgi:hypothetical protein
MNDAQIQAAFCGSVWNSDRNKIEKFHADPFPTGRTMPWSGGHYLEWYDIIASLMVVSLRKYTIECAWWFTFSERLQVLVARSLFPFQSPPTCVDNSSRLSHLTQHTSLGRWPATRKAWFTSVSFVSSLSHNFHLSLPSRSWIHETFHCLSSSSSLSLLFDVLVTDCGGSITCPCHDSTWVISSLLWFPMDRKKKTKRLVLLKTS